jgi:hypothetical protein
MWSWGSTRKHFGNGEIKYCFKKLVSPVTSSGPTRILLTWVVFEGKR